MSMVKKEHKNVDPELKKLYHDTRENLATFRDHKENHEYIQGCAYLKGLISRHPELAEVKE